MVENKNILEKKFYINAFLNVMKTAITTMFPVFTYMYVSRIFGTDGMGKLNFSKSYIMYFQLFAMLGVSNYAASCVAREKNDRHKLTVVTYEIAIINFSAMIVSYIALTVSIICFDSISRYSSIIIIYSIQILLQVIGIEWLYNGLEEFRYVTIRSAIFQVLSLAFMLIFVKNKNDLHVYAIIQVVSFGGANVFNIVHSRRYIDGLWECIKQIKPQRHLKSIVLIFFTAFFSTIFTHVDTIMLGVLVDDDAVGLYSAADKFSSLIAGLIGAISVVFLPKVAGLEKENNKDILGKAIITIFNVIQLIAIPCAVGVLLLSEEIILLFSGEDFVPAIVATRILSLRVLLSPINALMALYIFVPMKEEKNSLISTGIAAFVNIVANFILIPVIAQNGAAITTVSAEVIEMLVNLCFLRRIVKTSSIIRNTWNYIIASFPILFFYYVFSLFVNNLVIRVGLVTIVSAAVYFWLLHLLKNQYIEIIFQKTKARIRK